jgi:hypothetical protein
MIPGSILPDLKSRFSSFVHFHGHDSRRVILKALDKLVLHPLPSEDLKSGASTLPGSNPRYHVDLSPQTGDMAGIVSRSASESGALGKKVPKHISK